MDAKSNAANVLALAKIWEDMEPAFLDEALSSVRQDSEVPTDKDPLEAIVRSRVLAQIESTLLSDRVDVKKRFLFRDVFKSWIRSPSVRMTAAAVLIIAIVWIISMPFLAPGTVPTTAATSKAGLTTAATKVTDTTASAATTAAATSAATTRIETTKAAGTTAATSISPTATGQLIQITWPAQMIQYLGFDLSRVQSIDVRRYLENGLLDRSANVADLNSLNRIFNLVNQIYLEKPIQHEPQSIAVQYELVFNFDRLPGQVFPKDEVLQLTKIKDSSIIKINGSFTEIMKINALDGLVQANDHLTFDDIANLLDPLLP